MTDPQPNMAAVGRRAPTPPGDPMTTTLQEAGRRLAQARYQVKLAEKAAAQAAVRAAADGASEYTIAEALGVPRLAVRKMLGKPISASRRSR